MNKVIFLTEVRQSARLMRTLKIGIVLFALWQAAVLPLKAAQWIPELFWDKDQTWQKQLHAPEAVKVWFECDAQAGNGSGFTVKLNDAEIMDNGAGCSTPVTTSRTNTVLSLRKEYLLTVTGSSLSSIDITFQDPAPFKVMGKNEIGDFIPNSYVIYVDDLKATNAVATNPGGCTSYTNYWKIRVRPLNPPRVLIEPEIGSQRYRGKAENTFDREDYPEAKEKQPGDAGFPLLTGGYGTNAASINIAWDVSLGKLWDGKPVGEIRVNEWGISSNLYHPASLYTGIRSTNTNEVHIVFDGNDDYIRQIKAPQAFVNITSNQYASALTFYLPSQVSTNMTNGFYQILDDDPYVVWRISNPDQSYTTTNRVQFIEERNGETNVTEIEFDSSNDQWILSKGEGDETIIETRDISFDQNFTERIEVHEVQYTNGPTALKKAEAYHKFDWGWEQLVVTNALGTSNLVTRFSYITNSANEVLNGKLEYTIKPDGSWEKRQYHSYGLLDVVMRPWKGSPSHPDNADEYNSYSHYYLFGQTVYGEEYYVSRVTDWIPVGAGDFVVNDNQYHRMLWTYFPGSSDQAQGLRSQFMHFDGEGSERFSSIATYTPNAGHSLYGHLIYSRQPDSTQQSYYYDWGEYDSGTYGFTVSTNGHDFRTTKVTGLGSPGINENDSCMQGQVCSIDGHQIFQLQFVPGKSTKEVEIRQNGNLVQRETYAYTGTTATNTTFELFERVLYSYDAIGNLTNITQVDVESSASRVLYEADYTGSQDHPGDQLLWEKDETGAKIVYTYDSLERVETRTKKGVSGINGWPSQSDIVSTFSYDAHDQLITNVVSAGSLSTTNSVTYDQALRVTSIVETNGFETTTAYYEGGKVKAVTLPGGATRVETNYLDGRTYSLTGTAVVDEFYDFGESVDNAGSIATLYQQTNFFSPTSSRWVRTVIDRQQMPIRHERPGLSSTVTEKLIEYNNFDQIGEEYFPLTSVSSINEDSSDAYVNYYSYDEFARKFRETVHENINGCFGCTHPLDDLASTNRITETAHYYEKTGGDWFRVVEERAYLTNNSDVFTPTSIIREQLTGLGSGVQSIVEEIDADTNTTVITVSIDRADKLVTEVTDPPYSTLNATNYTYNHRDQAFSTPSVATPTVYHHDALGRVTRIVDPLGFNEGYRYDPDTGFLTHQTNAAQQVTSYEYYPATHVNAGELKSETANNNKKTYYAYNSRGQLTRTWGDVPYPEERVYDDYGDLEKLKTYRGGSGWSGSSWPSTTGTADVTTWNYDSASGLLLSKTDADSEAVTYDYYPNNERKTRTWARGVSVTNVYNNLGDLIAQQYSDSTPDVAFQDFDRRGRPTTIIDGTGTNTYFFDHAGRMSGFAGDSGIYDGISQTNHFNPVYGRDWLKVSISGQGSIQHDYGYDSYGRLDTVGYGNLTADYTYKSDSDLLKTVVHDNNSDVVLTTTRNWDYGYRLASISNSGDGGVITSHAYQYDSVDRRTRATLADNSYWSYDYNDRNELIGGRKYWSDDTPVAGQQFDYGYDNIGNREYSGEGGNEWGTDLRYTTYTANELNQYSLINSPGAFDVIGVATNAATVTVNNTPSYRNGDYFSCSISYDNAAGPVYLQTDTVGVIPGGGTGSTDLVREETKHALLPQAQTTLTYDDDGNLTNDGLWDYTWDGENRLVEMVSDSEVPASAKQKLEFTYDRMGRRATKKAYSWNGSWQLEKNQKCIYDGIGWNLLAELNATNNVPIRSYAWGLDLSGTLEEAGGIGALHVVSDHTATISHFVSYDGNGNVSALVNASNETTSAHYQYSPFGDLIRRSGDFAEGNPFRWSTKFWEEEGGFVIYPVRVYSPSFGRWLNRDPIEEEGGPNLYGFLLNDPINSLDPFGMNTLVEEQAAGGISMNMAAQGGVRFAGIVDRVENMVDAFNFVQELTYEMTNAADDEDASMAILMAGLTLGADYLSNLRKAPVIGHVPDLEPFKKAGNYNWFKGWVEGDKFAANMKRNVDWLRGIVNSGDDVIIASSRVRRGSITQAEIKYLKKHGYERQGSKMVKRKRR